MSPTGLDAMIWPTTRAGGTNAPPEPTAAPRPARASSPPYVMVCPNGTERCRTDSTVRRGPRALPRSIGTLNAFRRPAKYSSSWASAASSNTAACVPGAGAVPGGGPYRTRATPVSVQATDTWPTGVSRQPHASSVTHPIVPGRSDKTSRSALGRLGGLRRPGRLRVLRLLGQPAERAADRQRGQADLPPPRAVRGQVGAHLRDARGVGGLPGQPADHVRRERVLRWERVLVGQRR